MSPKSIQRMSRITEIADLFAKLASHLQDSQPSTSQEEALLPKISSLNRSLNLNNEGFSRVRVLDAALSLMCFKAPHVFKLEIECLVETIVSVLSSLVCCKVWRLQKDEFLKVGSSICCDDLRELFEALSDVFGKLDGYGMPSQSLLYAVLRVAVSSSFYQSSFPYTTITYKGSSHQKSTAISQLHFLLPEEILVDNDKVPLRLLFWYLDPLTLKNDVSEILREYIRRPFLSLKKELHERTSWCSVMICLVLAPTIFIETRALLHNWFLLTGLASIKDFEIELVSSVFDVLAQPMRWGMSMEVGSKLPFSHAYFPNNHQLLASLVGTISCEDFLGLVHLLGGLGYSVETPRNVRLTNHKSSWAMLMAFPHWFLFAAVLLFSRMNCQEKFLSKCIPYTVKTEQTHDLEQYRDAAARYLAQILCPTSEAHSDLLANYLIKLSESWKLIECDSDVQNGTFICTKKLRKFRLQDIECNNTANKEYDFQEMSLWLKKFHECHLRYLNETNDSSIPSAENRQKRNLLFRKIPLGIFIGYSNVDEKGYELLLHYASTGAILQVKRSQNVELKHIKQKFIGHDDDENLKTSSKDGDEKEEAKAGICLVFNLFDTIEEMTSSIFSTEESGLNFICQLKTKAVGFLVKCVGKLLQLNTDEDKSGILMLTDLYKRLIQWRRQGREDFKGCNALDEITNALNCIISSHKNVL